MGTPTSQPTLQTPAWPDARAFVKLLTPRWLTSRRSQRLEEGNELGLLGLAQLGITLSGVGALPDAAAVKPDCLFQGCCTPVMHVRRRVGHSPEWRGAPFVG